MGLKTMTHWNRREFVYASVGLATSSGVARCESERTQKVGDALKTIDTHIHVVNTRLPGSPKKGTPGGTAFGVVDEGPPGVPDKRAPGGTPFDETLEKLASEIKNEMQAAGVEQALCMPRWQNSADDPLGINETLLITSRVPGLHAIGIADPTRTEKDHFARVERVLRQGKVKAFKAYLGYLHYGPDSPNYRPYYELAARYDVPFVFHTGDTYSHMAKVKYAHPLGVDEVAVDFPTVKFVLAHVGYPWTIDTAEVLYKNNKKERANVWTDLSGLLVGSAEQFADYRKNGVVEKLAGKIREAFYYTECPDRFVYGSDWPLAPMAEYRDLIREVIPVEHHPAVFYDNSKALFKL
jgi:uncharacterized protein